MPGESEVVGYKVPQSIIEVEFEVKKSRFIACAGPATDRPQAMELLQARQQCYPDARHHCWAYVVGSAHSPRLVAMSDDGEPSGTAGKPILNVIQHKAIGDVMLVVSRYFGGVKLGAGGLGRAYSQAAQRVLEQLPVLDRVQTTAIKVSASFAQEQEIRHWLAKRDGQVLEVSYGQGVSMSVDVTQSSVNEFQEFAITRGILLQIDN